MVLHQHLAVLRPQVIVQYLLDKHSSTGPSLQPDTPELRAVAGLTTRIHDIYIGPIQVSVCVARLLVPLQVPCGLSGVAEWYQPGINLHSRCLHMPAEASRTTMQPCAGIKPFYSSTGCHASALQSI